MTPRAEARLHISGQDFCRKPSWEMDVSQALAKRTSLTPRCLIVVFSDNLGRIVQSKLSEPVERENRLMADAGTTNPME